MYLHSLNVCRSQFFTVNHYALLHMLHKLAVIFFVCWYVQFFFFFLYMYLKLPNGFPTNNKCVYYNCRIIIIFSCCVQFMFYITYCFYLFIVSIKLYLAFFFLQLHTHVFQQFSLF